MGNMIAASFGSKDSKGLQVTFTEGPMCVQCRINPAEHTSVVAGRTRRLCWNCLPMDEKAKTLPVVVESNAVLTTSDSTPRLRRLVNSRDNRWHTKRVGCTRTTIKPCIGCPDKRTNACDNCSAKRDAGLRMKPIRTASVKRRQERKWKYREARMLKRMLPEEIMA